MSQRSWLDNLMASIAEAFAEVWDRILITLWGKRVAILGARGVGKTHLVRFLTSGSLPFQYKQTVAPEKTAARRFDLKELELCIKNSRDVSGDKAAYPEWRKLHDEADLVFYLLRADRLIKHDRAVEDRVRDDLRHISDWRLKRNPRPHFIIICTHCDLDTEFHTLSPDNFGDYVDKFRRLPVVTELVAIAGGAEQVKVVLGSMKTAQGTEEIVYQAFMQVAT